MWLVTSKVFRPIDGSATFSRMLTVAEPATAWRDDESGIERVRA